MSETDAEKVRKVLGKYGEFFENEFNASTIQGYSLVNDLVKLIQEERTEGFISGKESFKIQPFRSERSPRPEGK